MLSLFIDLSLFMNLFSFIIYLHIYFSLLQYSFVSFIIYHPLLPCSFVLSFLLI
jgi:hypothetical protein